MKMGNIEFRIMILRKMHCAYRQSNLDFLILRSLIAMQVELLGINGKLDLEYIRNVRYQTGFIVCWRGPAAI
jgi:hypothetical protein